MSEHSRGQKGNKVRTPSNAQSLLQESGSLKTLLPKQDGKVLQAATFVLEHTYASEKKNKKDKAMDKNQYNKLEKKLLLPGI